MTDLKTPLYERHVKAGGKMVLFGGYLLPVTYKNTSLLLEHEAVRTKAGLFDVSHMGSFFLTGREALTNLQHFFTNDFANLADGQLRYTLMLNHEGGILDDLMVYRYAEDKYLLVVNAANKKQDFKWLESHLKGECVLENHSDELSILALQGPRATAILEKMVPATALPQQAHRFTQGVTIGNTQGMISRSGYTGEDGYEIYVPADAVGQLWDQLLALGANDGLIPCGLGARDTLRLEAGLPLYGHELSETIPPVSTKLDFAIKLNKPDFIGKQAIEAMPKKQIRVGLQVIGKGIVREAASLFNAAGQQVGVSTSGTYAPTLGYPIALGLVDVPESELGTELVAHVRQREIAVKVVPVPFYRRKK